MPKINFQELLQEAVKTKAEMPKESSKEKKLLDVAIVTLTCGFILSTLVTNCFQDSVTSVTASK
jgi:hypothetical protein